VSAYQSVEQTKSAIEQIQTNTLRAVDALAGQQKRPGDTFREAQVQKRPPQSGRVIEAGKVIESANCKHNVFDTPACGRRQDLAKRQKGASFIHIPH